MFFWVLICLRAVILFICYAITTIVTASVSIIIILTLKLFSKLKAKKSVQTEIITETKDGSNRVSEDFKLHI